VSLPAAGLPWDFVAFDTERLRIRPMTLDDVDELHAIQGREDVTVYLTHGPRSREEVVERMPRYTDALRLEKDGDWIQPAIEVEGRLVGWLYLNLASVEHLGAEIGWTLHPDVHGRGYATEGAAALLDLAFGELGLHRVRAELDPRNAGSIGVCRRLGMREEALHVRDFHDERIPGGWGDTGVWAILGDEWAAHRGVTPAP
jgi:RimJ/RimL family protein N-acetyltransferase